MRSLILTIVVLVLSQSMTTQAVQTQTQNNKETEEKILKLEREWLDSYLKNDVETLKRVLADNFTKTYSNGRVLTKEQEIESQQQEIESLRKGSSSQWPDLSLTTEDTQVRIYGDTAVVTGRLIEKGANFKFQSRYTDTYVRQRGQWRVVASQLTRLPEERAAIQLDSKSHDFYTGQYETPAKTFIVVTSESGKLMIQPPGMPKNELVPTAEAKFFIKGTDVTVDFTGDQKDGITGLVVYLNGNTIKAKKVK